MTDQDDNVLNFEEIRTMEQDFRKWQCRVRQRSVREYGGRPDEAIQPWLTLAGQDEPLMQITTVLIKKQPGDDNAQLRFINQKTEDPHERYKKGLEHLQEWFYQYPDEFSDRITALFRPESRVPDRLLQDGRCQLHFADRHRSYRFPCKVSELGEESAAYQATYWHNSVFNPELPGGVRILAFDPHWSRAEADPSPTEGR